jgi:opacity protein-like surface antigen
MMHIKSRLLAGALALLISAPVAFAQDDLMDILNESEPEEAKTEYAIATFKSTRLVAGHSIETNGKGVLNVLIGHRFGRVNEGAKEFFGIDNAKMRLGLEYGITDNINIGFGRSTFQKCYDGFIKYKVLRQSKGKKKMPLSMTLFASMAIVSQDYADPTRENYFTSRMYYSYQIMIARKFSERLSFQLTPTIVHRNLVKTADDANTVFALGAGGRVKITKSFSLNLEYYWVPQNQIVSAFDGQKVRDSFSVGFDLETGGHVFQIHATNSRGLHEKAFVTETNGDWGAGDIHIGFNISRVFTVYNKNKFKQRKADRLAKKAAKA